MTRSPADLVRIDADTLVCVCPYHGPQPGAEYEAGRAPCGCDWQTDAHGLLWVRERADSLRLPQHDVQVSAANAG